MGLIVPISDVPGQYTTAIQALRQIAETYFYAGRLSDAVRILALGADIAIEPEVRHQDYVALLIQFGTTLTWRGSLMDNEYDTALTILRQAEQIARTTTDHHLIAGAVDALGFALYHKVMTTGLGSFDEPHTYFQQALSLREASADQQGVCESLFHVGLIAERTQQYDDALAAFYQARSLAEQHNYKRELADALRHIGFAYARAGDIDQALKSFQQALVLLEGIEIVLFLPFAHLSVGEMLYEQQKWDEAMHHYHVAYVQAEQMRLRRATMQIAYSKGELYEAKLNPVQARQAYEDAYKWAKELRFKRGMEMCAAKLHGISP
jgi:tetratricopeptide (TPR) repeat protein